MLCAYLSIALLVGLGANALLGWWWADPMTGLVIAAVAVKEGVHGWRGEADGCCAPLLVADASRSGMPGRLLRLEVATSTRDHESGMMFSFIVTPPSDLRSSTRRATSTSDVG